MTTSRLVFARALAPLLAGLVCLLPACAGQAPSGGGSAAVDAGATGTAQLALTGALPGVTRLTLSIYDGPVSDLAATSPTFQPVACGTYAGAGGNRIKLQYLKASSNYTLYVELFGDDKCEKRVGFGWRGNVEVSAGNDLSDTVPTYYIQPYLYGQFTGLAPVPQALQDAAKIVSCTADTDCKAIHANGSCGSNNKCQVDSLFPLDGGARRGFASSLPRADGGVALLAGFTAPSGGAWAASKREAEIFDPLAGYFRAVPDSEHAFLPVGLAPAVTDGAASVVLVGGGAGFNLSLTPGSKLSASLDQTGCPGSSCAVSTHIQRWDLDANTHADLPMTSAPGVLPIVSRVHGKTGDFVLVAGGAAAPVSKNIDSRQANATLCDLSQKGVITCKPSTASMLAPRAHAATACLASTADGTCTKLFILGGRKKAGTPLAEAYDAETDNFVPVTVQGDGSLILHGGTLHKLANGNFLLLGAAHVAPMLEDDSLSGTASLQPPMIVSVSQGASSLTMQLAPVPMAGLAGTDGGKRLLATSVSLRGGGALLLGGVDEKLAPVQDGILFDGNGQPVGRAQLAGARLAASATVVGGQTALAGCVLVMGGFTLAADGLTAIPQNHVEAFCPAP